MKGLRVLPPLAEVPIREMPPPTPGWLEAPEFLALTELRLAMAGGAVPSEPPQTAEEDARQAVFWSLYELEHILREHARLVEAGEPVRLRAGVYVHARLRVDFNVRIVEEPEIEIHPQAQGGAA
jgi:hypothetical protein